MMDFVIFMVIIIYKLYYYYCSDMDGASKVHFLWTCGVWLLIPSIFGYSEFIGVADFQFRALADET